MTKLEILTFERAKDTTSSLIQLDVSGNNLAVIDISGLAALRSLDCEENPISDILSLQAWAVQEGHEAKLPQAQGVAPEQPATDGNAETPSESQEPDSPDTPTGPAESVDSDVPSEEPVEPSEPVVPGEPEQPSESEQPGEANMPGESEQPGDADVPADAGRPDNAQGVVEPEQPEEPAGTPTSDEVERGGDFSVADGPVGSVELDEAGEEPLALVA